MSETNSSHQFSSRPRRSKKSKPRSGGGFQKEVMIESLGAQGDGIAYLPDQTKPLFVPLTVPQDKIICRVYKEQADSFYGEVLELLEESPLRREPPCPHFGRCGGCHLQQIEEQAYDEWKQERIASLLEEAGFSKNILKPVKKVSPKSRRRARLSLGVGEDQKTHLGFRKRKDKSISTITECQILEPKLLKLVPFLEEVLLKGQFTPKDQVEVHLLLVENGIDILITGYKDLSFTTRQVLVDFCQEHQILRLSYASVGEEPDLLYLLEEPALVLEGAQVLPPPGVFVQPVQEGQQFLIESVLAFCPPKMKRCVDLYSGLGTFSFPVLKAYPKVTLMAVEGYAPALEALAKAAKKEKLWGQVMVEERDLERWPLESQELENVDCLIFDPPRSGAKAQSEELSTSSIPCIIAVSCNPSTFIRDALVLEKGGYTLTSVQPIDQFLWTGHLELVAQFKKEAS